MTIFNIAKSSNFTSWQIKSCLVIGAWLSVIISAPPVRAQPAGLSISPPTVEIILSPNKNITQAFTVTNQGESTNFVANIHSVTPVGPNGHAVVDPRPLGSGNGPLLFELANSDLALGRPFTLPSQTPQQLVLSLKGAVVTEPVDTYLALVVQPVSPSASSSIIASNPGISALILVTSTNSDRQPVNVSVSGFDLPLFHDNSQPLTPTPSVANDAPVMLRFSGEYTVKGPRGDQVLQLPLYNNLVLANTNRVIQGVNSEGEPLPLTWQPRWYHLGRFTLHLSVSTVGGRVLQEVERSVWVLPLRALLIVLIAVIVWILLIFLKKHRSKLPIDRRL